MAMDPVEVSAVLMGARVALRLVELLVLRRGTVRDHLELVRRAAGLPPGSRIVSRHAAGGYVLRVEIGGRHGE